MENSFEMMKQFTKMVEIIQNLERKLDATSRKVDRHDKLMAVSTETDQQAEIVTEEIVKENYLNNNNLIKVNEIPKFAIVDPIMKIHQHRSAAEIPNTPINGQSSNVLPMVMKDVHNLVVHEDVRKMNNEQQKTVFPPPAGADGAVAAPGSDAVVALVGTPTQGAVVALVNSGALRGMQGTRKRPVRTIESSHEIFISSRGAVVSS